MTNPKERYRQMCELAACVYTDEELEQAPGIHMSESVDNVVKRGAYLLKHPGELRHLAQDTWDSWYDAWRPHIEKVLEKTNDSPNT